MMKRGLLMMLAMLMAVMRLAAQTDTYIFRHFTTTDGLLNNEVKTVLRDRYGYLWIGTVSGLNRWDGYRLKAYENAEGRMGELPEGDILSLQEDGEGNVWVEGRGTYAVYQRQTDRFISADQLLAQWQMPAEGLRRVFVDSEGHVWAVVGGRLYCHRSDAEPPTQTALPKDVDVVQVASTERNLYLMGRNGRLYALDLGRGNWSQVDLPAEGRGLNGLFIDHTGSLWVFSTMTDVLYFREQGQ